jgi:hypothetical protein
MLHPLKTHVDREVPTASAAIPLLNVSELVVSLAVANYGFGFAVNASINLNRFDNRGLNDGS